MHVCKLLSHRMQRYRGCGHDIALERAVQDLHSHTFANFAHWRHHLALKISDHAERKHAAKTRERRERSRPWRTNMLLHELALFYLIWGEAANLRHLPECLCFVFYCARQRLSFPRQRLARRQEEDKEDKETVYKEAYDQEDCVLVQVMATDCR